MKKQILLTGLLTVSTFSAVIFSSCTKEDVTPKKTGCMDITALNFDNTANQPCAGCCQYKGSVVFWNSEDDDLDFVHIIANGGKDLGTITKNYNSTPNCDATGCVTLTGAPGQYHFSAWEEGTSRTWDGFVTITSRGCNALKLGK